MRAFRPESALRITRTVPEKSVVGDNAIKSTSLSPSLFSIPRQCKRVKALHIAAVAITVKSPWRTRTTRMVVPTSTLAHQLKFSLESDANSAQLVAKVMRIMTAKRTEETATMAAWTNKSSRATRERRIVFVVSKPTLVSSLDGNQAQGGKNMEVGL